MLINLPSIRMRLRSSELERNRILFPFRKRLFGGGKKDIKNKEEVVQALRCVYNLSHTNVILTYTLLD